MTLVKQDTYEDYDIFDLPDWDERICRFAIRQDWKKSTKQERELALKYAFCHGNTAIEDILYEEFDARISKLKKIVWNNFYWRDKTNNQIHKKYGFNQHHFDRVNDFLEYIDVKRYIDVEADPHNRCFIEVGIFGDNFVIELPVDYWKIVRKEIEELENTDNEQGS